ncbi:hypothetical protein [Pontibaca salina]|uniref:Lipoprotein n=1 Tax=Pontibaca salina TaxID=2795731 RepID=A0A934HRN2_9RHOB|nr:hypothetical protein [Pontibaca salina]MBI6629310.1 hypothetical protein [Pontibaca salina]
MRRLLCLGALLLVVAGCATRGPVADDEIIAAVSYRDPGPTSLTLYTMVNNRTGKGGHSALLINGYERVIFDPAGSFQSDLVPQRDDVLFGITPAIEQAYRSSHARSTYHVVRQTIDVTPQQAEAAYRMALDYGPVPGAFCAAATSRVLNRVPGFEEAIRPTMFPTKLRDQVAALPDVTSDKYYEGGDANLQKSMQAANRALLATAASAD